MCIFNIFIDKNLLEVTFFSIILNHQLIDVIPSLPAHSAQDEGVKVDTSSSMRQEKRHISSSEAKRRSTPWFEQMSMEFSP